MSYSQRAYIEHIAVYVKNIPWYMEFFEKTLNFTERMRKEENGELKQVWLYGGIQLIQLEEEMPSGKLAHLGIMVEDQAAVLNEIYKYKVKEMPQGHNWVALPDGLCLEILQAAPGSVEEALKVTPWE